MEAITYLHRFKESQGKSSYSRFLLHYHLIKLNEEFQQLAIVDFLAPCLFICSSPLAMCLEVEHLFQYPQCMLRIVDTMSNSPAIFENLVIVSTFVCLVAEEVDSRVINTTERLLRFQVLQTVSLIPASGKYIEGNLSAD